MVKWLVSDDIIFSANNSGILLVDKPLLINRLYSSSSVDSRFVSDGWTSKDLTGADVGDADGSGGKVDDVVAVGVVTDGALTAADGGEVVADGALT